MNIKNLEIEFRYLCGSIACMSVNSTSGQPIHNDINNDEAIKIFNALIGSKENSILEENKQLQQERDKYKSIVEKLKEQIKIGMGKFSNKNYGLVFDIEEVPKEEMNDFITCLAMQTMEAILIQIECNKIKELEEGNSNESN